MEQFMKHFLDVLLHADPEDIVSSFDDDMEDDCEEEEEDSGDWDGDMPEFLERSTNVYRTRFYIVASRSCTGATRCSGHISAAATLSIAARLNATGSTKLPFLIIRKRTGSAFPL